MAAVDAIVDHLKTLSRPVTTPEEIAQVRMAEHVDTSVYLHIFSLYRQMSTKNKIIIIKLNKVLRVLVFFSSGLTKLVLILNFLLLYSRKSVYNIWHIINNYFVT